MLKLAKDTLKIFCCEYRKILKACSVSFQHYAWKGQGNCDCNTYVFLGKYGFDMRNMVLLQFGYSLIPLISAQH